MNLSTLVNIAVVGVLLYFVFSGYRQGFLVKLIGIFSFFVIGFLSWYLSGFLANWISIYPHEDTQLLSSLYESMLNHITLFVILFVILQLVFLFLRPLIHILHHIPVVSFVNRMAGGLLGLVQGVLLLCLLAMVLRLPLWKQGSEVVANSYLRYSDAVTKKALFYTKEPISELQAFDGMLRQHTALTKADASKLHAWLLKQNIKKENADKIMNMLLVK